MAEFKFGEKKIIVQERTIVIISLLLVIAIILIIMFLTFTALKTDLGQEVIRNEFGLPEKSVAVFMGPQRERNIAFELTYIFWVPKYTEIGGSIRYDSERYDVLHDWLVSNFGGYTRWRVMGEKEISEMGMTEEAGYFYMSSAVNDPPSKKDIFTFLASVFQREELYIISISHR